MGAFFSYAIVSGLYLLAGYLVYVWLLSGEKQPRLNRAILWGIYAAAFAALPVMRLVSALRAAPAGDAGNVAFDLAVLGVGAMPEAAPLWPRVLLWIYLGGMLAVALWSLVVALRLRAVIRSGSRDDRGEYTLVVLDGDGVAPFSWGRYVVVGRADLDAAGDLIIAHELGHLRAGHWVDLLVAQAVCVVEWFNPAAWLMREELKSVHEYQADSSVLDAGADARRYQMLLIKKAVGTRFQSLANSLNHSKLKKRITMMYNQKPKAARRLRALALVPALAAALAVTDIPAVAAVLSNTRSAELSPAKVTEKSAPVQEADAYAGATPQSEKKEPTQTTVAMYPGGERELFRFLAENVRYPASAMEKNIEGKVVVSFTVEASGEITDIKIARSVDPELDAEAMRVVRIMPDWTPATADGEAVACSFALPVEFKLTSSGKKAPSTSNNVATEKTLDDVRVVAYSSQPKQAAARTDSSNVMMLRTDKVTVVNDGPKVNMTKSEGARPAVFVDGKLFTGDLNSIDSSSVESMSVQTNLPEYPDGRIDIKLKK